VSEHNIRFDPNNRYPRIPTEFSSAQEALREQQANIERVLQAQQERETSYRTYSDELEAKSKPFISNGIMDVLNNFARGQVANLPMKHATQGGIMTKALPNVSANLEAFRQNQVSTQAGRQKREQEKIRKLKQYRDQLDRTNSSALGIAKLQGETARGVADLAIAGEQQGYDRDQDFKKYGLTLAELGIKRTQLEVALKSAGGKTFDQEKVLRQEFNKDLSVRYYRDADRAMQDIEGAIERGTGMDDLQLVFKLMHILDPESVVREGEAKAAQRAQSIFNQIGVQISSVLKGDQLSESQRTAIHNLARQNFLDREAEYKAVEGTYKDLAEANQLTWANIGLNFRPEGRGTPDERVRTEDGDEEVPPPPATPEEESRAEEVRRILEENGVIYDDTYPEAPTTETAEDDDEADDATWAARAEQYADAFAKSVMDAGENVVEVASNPERMIRKFKEWWNKNKDGLLGDR
jgi:hypothetical protein